MWHPSMAPSGFARNVTWPLRKTSPFARCAIHASNPFIFCPQQLSPVIGLAQGARKWWQDPFQRSRNVIGVARQKKSFEEWMSSKGSNPARPALGKGVHNVVHAHSVSGKAVHSADLKEDFPFPHPPHPQLFQRPCMFSPSAQTSFHTTKHYPAQCVRVYFTFYHTHKHQFSFAFPSKTERWSDPVSQKSASLQQCIYAQCTSLFAPSDLSLLAPTNCFQRKQPIFWHNSFSTHTSSHCTIYHHQPLSSVPSSMF